MEKLTPKQDAFAQAYVETGNASEAYRRLYDAARMKPEVVAVKASELLKNGKVTVRVEALQARHAKRHDITIDSLTAELEQARAVAMEQKQASAAVSATLGKAKLHGLLVEKVKAEGDVNLYVSSLRAAHQRAFDPQGTTPAAADSPHEKAEAAQDDPYVKALRQLHEVRDAS